MSSLDTSILRWVDEMPDDFHRRLVSRLVPSPDGCLLWSGSRSSKFKYGSVMLPGALKREGARKPSPVYVHRAMWLAVHGPIKPVQLVVDHDDPTVGCKTRHCANVEHLVLVTKGANTRRGATRAGRFNGKCRNGHDVDPAVYTCPTCFTVNSERRKTIIKDAATVLGITPKEFVRRHGNSVHRAQSVLQEDRV